MVVSEQVLACLARRWIDVSCAARALLEQIDSEVVTKQLDCSVVAIYAISDVIADLYTNVKLLNHGQEAI